MNDAVDTTNKTFWAISAEAAFKVVFKHFLETQYTPQAIEKRLDRIKRSPAPLVLLGWKFARLSGKQVWR
jgi:hypothetical protein